tara:strand:+ start:315 stop:839 length:525 start_codon:yes stop_codon:yes gene_type:complete
MPILPKELNQLNVVSFETNFLRMPSTNFFCQQVTIPSIALGNAILPTQFSSVPVEGDTLVFENLNISFYVNEDLSNYMEVYNWLIAIGFPDEFPQFNLNGDAISSPSEFGTIKSDMNVIVQTNKTNPNYNITFKDAFPTSLGAIPLDATATDMQPIVVDATFAYTGSFTIAKIG